MVTQDEWLQLARLKEALKPMSLAECSALRIALAEYQEHLEYRVDTDDDPNDQILLDAVLAIRKRVGDVS